MQRRSSLHYRHLALGARMTDEEWPQPAHYADPAAELAALNGSCGLVDLSATPKWEVRGISVPEYVAAELASSSATPVARSAGYRACGDGPDDYWCLTSEDRALLMSPLSVPTQILSIHTTLSLTDVTSVLAQLVLAGNGSREVLSRLTSLNLRELGHGSCAQGAIARCHCTFVRLDVRETPAYRLLLSRDLAEFVWEAVVNAGATPAGLDSWRALNAQRLMPNA